MTLNGVLRYYTEYVTSKAKYVKLVEARPTLSATKCSQKGRGVENTVSENAGPENAGLMISSLRDQKCGRPTGKCGP